MKRMGRVEGQGFGGSFLTSGMMGAVILAAIVVGSGTPARAQNEKRTVFTENDFHWQGNLKEGQTLEVINRNGNIDASSATGGAAQVGGTKHEGDENDFFIEVVEYSDGVTICAVYAKDRTPGRCHRGGVRVAMGSAKWDGELRLTSTNGSVHVTLPASAEFSVNAATTNGGIHTDFPITVQGTLTSKDLSGKVGAGGRELHVATTNGGIELKKS